MVAELLLLLRVMGRGLARSREEGEDGEQGEAAATESGRVSPLQQKGVQKRVFRGGEGLGCTRGIWSYLACATVVGTVQLVKDGHCSRCRHSIRRRFPGCISEYKGS